MVYMRGKGLLYCLKYQLIKYLHIQKLNKNLIFLNLLMILEALPCKQVQCKATLNCANFEKVGNGLQN